MQGSEHQGKRLLSFFRRHPFLDATLIFLLACRLALPLVLRPIVAARASDAINGRVEIGDLDLWLLRGAVALQDVAVFLEGAGAPPIITWRNLYVRISWPDLFKRSLRLRSVRLESPRVHADRLKSGTLNLSRLIRSRPAAVETPPASSPGWTVAADALVVTTGTVAFQDYTVGNPLRIEATVNRLQVQEVSLNHGTYEEPTRIELQAHVEGAPLHVTAHLSAAEKGVRLQAVVKGKDLPLRLARLYIPSTGWSQLHGRLDGTVHYRMESGIHDELRGHVTLRDLVVRVPELDRPALRWGSLAVDVDRLDLLHHHATVKSINAVDAAVVVQPAGPVLVPLLGGAASAAEPPAGRGDSPSDGDKEESTGKRGDQPHAAPPSARDDRHP